MALRVLPLENIHLEENIYPRNQVNWHTQQAYADAMKTGAKFPVIVVAVMNKKYVIIDGAHRYMAMKQNGETITTAEVIKVKDEKEAFVEATKRNANHGRPFCYQEKLKIASKLMGWKMDKPDVAKLLGIQESRLAIDISNRVIKNAVTGKETVLKAPFVGTDMANEDPNVIDKLQKGIYGSSQMSILDETIDLLKSDAIELNETNIKKLKRIRSYINELFAIEIPVSVN